MLFTEALQCGEMIANIPAPIRQNFNRCDFKREGKAFQELLILLGAASQYVRINEDLPAGKINFLQTETRCILKMRLQLRESDLLQTVIGWR